MFNNISYSKQQGSASSSSNSGGYSHQEQNNEKKSSTSTTGRIEREEKFAMRCPHCIFTHKASDDCQYVKLFRSLSGLSAPFLKQSNSAISRMWCSLSSKMEDNTDVVNTRREIVTIIKSRLLAVKNNEQEKELFRKDYLKKIEEFYQDVTEQVQEIAKEIAKEHNINVSFQSLPGGKGPKSKRIYPTRHSQPLVINNVRETKRPNDGEDLDGFVELSDSYSSEPSSIEEETSLSEGSDFDSSEEEESNNDGDLRKFKRITRASTNSNPQLADEIVGPLQVNRRKRRKREVTSSKANNIATRSSCNKESTESGGLFRNINSSDVQQESNRKPLFKKYTQHTNNLQAPSKVVKVVDVETINENNQSNTAVTPNSNSTYFSPTNLPITCRTVRDYEDLFLSTSTPTTEQLYNLSKSIDNQMIDRRVIVYATFLEETVIISNTLQEASLQTIILKIHSKFPELPPSQFCTFYYWDDFIFKLVRFDTDALNHILNTQQFPIIKVTIKTS